MKILPLFRLSARYNVCKISPPNRGWNCVFYCLIIYKIRPRTCCHENDANDAKEVLKLQNNLSKNIPVNNAMQQKLWSKLQKQLNNQLFCNITKPVAACKHVYCNSQCSPLSAVISWRSKLPCVTSPWQNNKSFFIFNLNKVGFCKQKMFINTFALKTKMKEKITLLSC